MSRARPQPATWNMGVTTMPTFTCWRGTLLALDRALMNRLSWLSITPLGRPVVPPVYMTAARSLPLRSASAQGVAAASNCS